LIPRIGDRAPSFTLLDQDKQARSLDELTAKGRLVLAFFPGAFTSTCTREMCTIRDRLQDLSSQVVGISVNDPWTLKGFAERNRLTYPLLSDYTREVIRTYGLEYPDFGGVKGYSVAQRSVFILDESGRITYVWIAPEPGVEPDYSIFEAELNKAR
jgi:peroxiredoxin